MAFDKNDPYPCLMVESSSNDIPNLDISGSNSILSSLLQQNYIGEYKSHSAQERQSVSFIEEKLTPLIESALLPLKEKVQFYSVPRHFKQVEIRRELSDFAPLYFWKIFKAFHFYRKDKKEARDAENPYMASSK